ncbi:hypothetical protein [Natrinema salinisoli]|uniref:hypothetical protein n=1 Tax=Natrinema salinisoli TaxID=2878535 RepID=UPI001CF02766|nr:hypothetical protein [Natrinema salinisoli]
MPGDTGTPGARIDVTEWRDIDDVTGRITERQKQLVKERLNAGLPGDDYAVVWLPEFIRDKDLETIEGDDQLHVCRVEDYSDDAWTATQDGMDDVEYLPKSWTIAFRRGEGFDRVESEQTGLTAW